MKILISNDDGINSLGIYALAKSLKEIGDVTVVAPITEQSAVGHAITMKAPLRVVEHYINGEFFGYAVEGTPASLLQQSSGPHAASGRHQSSGHIRIVAP